MKPLVGSCIVILLLSLAACGGRKKDGGAAPKKADAASEKEATEDKEKAVETAKTRLQEWLSSDLVKRVSEAGKGLGKNIGLKIAANPKVLAEAKTLSKSVFNDKDVKAKLKKIEEKATSGFSNKISLGWKALKAGGVDDFRKKVNEDAQRVAVEVLSIYIKDHVLKDERMAALLKDFAPVVKLRGQIAAVSLQKNLSPRVNKEIMGIAMRIAVAEDNLGMTSRMDQWLHACEGDVDPRIDNLMRDIGSLSSVEKSTSNLAIEVLKHQRTKKELVDMTLRLVEDSAVNKAMVKVYEAAAFEKGDPAIQKAIADVLAIPIVDQELFVALGNLASAEGAGAIIGKHLTVIGEDVKASQLIEDFVLSVLETCGDPTKP